PRRVPCRCFCALCAALACSPSSPARRSSVPFGSPQFTGLENVERLIGDKIFWTSFGNTLYYSAIHLPVTFEVQKILSPIRRSTRSAEHTPELQSRFGLVCCLLLEKRRATGRA